MWNLSVKNRRIWRKETDWKKKRNLRKSKGINVKRHVLRLRYPFFSRTHAKALTISYVVARMFNCARMNGIPPERRDSGIDFSTWTASSSPSFFYFVNGLLFLLTLVTFFFFLLRCKFLLFFLFLVDVFFSVSSYFAAFLDALVTLTETSVSVVSITN